ncbi:hypothetical protein Trco_001047 [Trichoderma cornu-damae]|uniref:Ricin B lectin domain-containing protein n=1 Tax=Trichoderma cornu-damae TaxID=654480 RepID=A0A9P8QY80_9HYPO|nr:hypothetical protein Trco_001047 [Trichoderma cornu-damae]
MNESFWETASATTTTSADDCPTPTFSNMSDPPVSVREKDDSSSVITIQSVEHHPKADRSFVIRERREPHRVVALENGELKIVNDPSVGGGWLWQCVKKSGWYGFRNTASGTYLGHNGQQKIVAVAPHHKAHEFFMAERHEEGGYVLLMRHNDELLQVAISRDGRSLMEQKVGTSWDFIEADAVRIPLHMYLPSEAR